jgi:hypothetical protein
VWSLFLEPHLRPTSITVAMPISGRLVAEDPRYSPTSLASGSTQSIFTGDAEVDMAVSRGHCMLREYGGGQEQTNGVPRRGGGKRPTTKTTVLPSPERRLMRLGERDYIPSGGSVTIRLANGTVLEIRAR